MKKLLPVLCLFLLFGCKKQADVRPSEIFEILPNHSIALSSRSTQSSFLAYRFEKTGNKYVGYYEKDIIGDLACNDCGNPFIAFEFDPTLSTFSYTTTSDFENAQAINGMTSSFFGAWASRIVSSKIEGKKMDNNTWYIILKVKRQDQPEETTLDGYFRVK